MEEGFIESYICGGLGNQMFQYAVARAVSFRLCLPLCLNISAYASVTSAPSHARWRLPLFPFAILKGVSISVTPPSRLHSYLRRISLFAQTHLHRHISLSPRIIIEPHSEYWHGIENISAPCSLYGYWQSEKYFRQYADQIRKDFSFPALPEGEPQELAARINSCQNAVSVHIRRGDYVSNSDTAAFHGLPSLEYYRSALAHIRSKTGKTIIFAFSDEPQWVRKNFDACGHTLEVVDLNLPESPQHDMHLMALCRHHIIANSSFSWWGAWLSEKDGITVAPSRWFVDPAINTDDVCPPTWLRLES